MEDPDSGYKPKKKRTIEVVKNEIAECNNQINEIKNVKRNGWILVDFPSNFVQAMLLEKSLSGYVMKEDLEPT